MRVRADVFPAIIVVTPNGSITQEALPNLTARNTATYPEGSRRLDRCRVTIIESTILVAVDSPTGPTLVFRDEVASHSKDATREHRVLTVSGKGLAFIKDENCGCGSRLRSWNPYGATVTAYSEDSE